MSTPHAARGGRAMSGKIIHIPLAHRREPISKIAARMAAAPTRHAEKQLRMALQRQVDGLHRKGVPSVRRIGIRENHLNEWLHACAGD
jgi:hypothetical protein